MLHYLHRFVFHVVWSHILYQMIVCCTGAWAFSGERERHAVTAQTLEQADSERQGTLHPHAALVTWPTRPNPQPSSAPGSWWVWTEKCPYHHLSGTFFFCEEHFHFVQNICVLLKQTHAVTKSLNNAYIFLIFLSHFLARFKVQYSLKSAFLFN